jgi:hypothetical protein
MVLKKAKHPNPKRVRKRLLETSLKALDALRVELDGLIANEIGVTKVWAETYKLVADQIRRDLPDREGQRRAKTPTEPAPQTKPTLGGLKLVG